MDMTKLFRLLVVGGSLLAAGGLTGAGAGCGSEENQPDANGGIANGSADAAAQGAADAATGATDAATGAPDAAAGEFCGFCPNDCCVDDGNGGSKEKEGFVCCWSTSC